MTRDDHEPGESASLTVPWRMAAIAATLVAIAAVASLVVVTAVKKADTLSTVALALAVLAFVVQLLVFIAQSTSAHEQSDRNRALYGQTEGLLTHVRASTEATQAVLTRQFDVVLRHALGRDVGGEEEESGEPGRGDRAAQSDRIVELQRSLAATIPVETPPAAPSRMDLDIAEVLSTFPPESEGRPYLDILNSLPPLLVGQLQVYADREISRRRSGRTGDVTYLGPEKQPLSTELTHRGLLELVESEVGDRKKIRLSADGRQVARFLSAKPPLPEYVLKAVPARG